MFYQQYPDYNSSEHSQNAPDPWSTTQPSVRYNRRPSRRNTPPVWMRRRHRRTGCIPAIAVGLILGLILAVYLLAPFRTNVLLLGIDYTDPGSTLGRSDTIILTTFIPLQPYIGMLSIPRDLWIKIPGVGENRINTAHFFAESQQPGSGPAAAMQAIQVNFGVGVRYYIRIRFQGFRDVINAMGGVDVDLPEPMAGYPAGRHHLTGNKALAFARQRYGSDDFFRMEHGQLIMKSVFKEMLNPLKWPRLPGMFLAFAKAVDTNIPWWQWPRLAMALLRAGPDGIDNRTITREMVTPFTTSQGANVLLPNWALINPVLLQMFDQ